MIIYMPVSLFEHRPERCPFGHSVAPGTPGPELGAHRVHGAVRRGDAGPDRPLRLAPGVPRECRSGGVRLDHPHADLAGRPRRGVAAVAPGLPRVLQAAGPHAGPAPGTDGRTRPSVTDGRTRPDPIVQRTADPIVQGTDAASRVCHLPTPATDGRPPQRTSSYTAPLIPRL